MITGYVQIEFYLENFPEHNKGQMIQFLLEHGDKRAMEIIKKSNVTPPLSCVVCDPDMNLKINELLLYQSPIEFTFKIQLPRLNRK